MAVRPDTARARPEPVPSEFARHVPEALADVNVPAYVLDEDGRIRWLNAAAEKITGDVVGLSVTDVVDLDRRMARAIFERRLAGEDVGDQSFTVIGRDGHKTRVEVSSVPIGNGHHAVGMFGL